jgi:TPP-dependent 2-oxoacid decarboxylase
MESGRTTIGDFLIQKLYDHGLRHAFGIPGDYVLAFYKQLFDSKIKVINTADEQGAGYAANAYARVRGLGAVSITYGVGGEALPAKEKTSLERKNRPLNQAGLLSDALFLFFYPFIP